jgi:Putative DNA-binding domain
MPSLAELQHQFAGAVLTGDAPAALFAGRVSPDQALAIHRGTIMAALVNALRLSYPTVDALVGEAFFDQTCHIFAEAHPPRTASLADYGEAFGDFLADFAPAAGLPYLPDVARLDRAIEAALRAPSRQRRFALDSTVSIELPQSLTVLRLAYPADEIRAALGDDAAMAAIDTRPAERFILVWRKQFDAAVQRVSEPAGHFLITLLKGADADAGFAAAMAAASEADAMSAIQADIFASAFCTIISTPRETLS